MLLTDIGSLVVVPPGPLRGEQMRSPRTIPGAALRIENGRIAWFGAQRDLPRAAAEPSLSAAGGTVLPGLVDCHTHIPFIGSRCDEFVRRLSGETYLSILESGGGIQVTTMAVRSATHEQLVAANLPRLSRMLAGGVTTCECKSGYGLSPDEELKQLGVVRELAARQPVELVSTYMGAHALPPEYTGRSEAFLDAMSDEALLRSVREQGLAEFCDVFCDRGAFDVAQARRYLGRCAAAGLRPKLHADELAQIGASRLAAEMRAASADHLEHVDAGAIEALRGAGTIAVVLPGTSFYLGIPHADARGMIAGGLPVAIATDCNPGSCMIESLPLVMNIACCQLRLLPVEVVSACTANAAAALDLHRRKGAIAPGFNADLLVLDAPSVEEWLYAPGRERVRAVLRAGRVVSGKLSPTTRQSPT
jgi:imidazolonepropionase